MKPHDYPLKQVIEVKQRRVDNAEKVVLEKKQLLEKEQKKLAELEAERDRVKEHKLEKLKQLRETMDEETTTDKIQQMKAYLKVVDEKLKVEEKKVKDQKAQVDLAEKALAEAKKELHQKRQDLEKIVTHRKGWEKEVENELRLKEATEEDEIGSIIHSLHNRK
jgi:hypothetical protein